MGPEGATIGTSAECTVQVPPQSEVWPRHARISWTTGETLSDYIIHVHVYTVYHTFL